MTLADAMIETAAEAIWDQERRESRSITIACTPWSRLAEDAREKRRKIARAALTAVFDRVE